mgnify:CR=1 FL=1
MKLNFNSNKRKYSIKQVVEGENYHREKITCRALAIFQSEVDGRTLETLSS